jgi:predicted Zn-dependent peptidase
MHAERIPTLRRSGPAGALAALAACASLALAAVPAAAQAPSHEAIDYPRLPEFEIPSPERVVLDNGMVVMLLEDHELPLVDAMAVVRTGGRWEPADRLGLADLAGEVLRTGGTEEMSADELDDWLENQAASIESSITTELGLARMSSLAEDFPTVLGVFADVLRRPAFAADRLEVARTRIETGIARQNDQPLGILFREIADLVYGADSPYARNPTYETVGAIDRDDLAAWHRRWFHPDRVILGLVGDFDREEALALVRKEFGDWARGPEIDAPDAGWKESPAPGIYHVPKGDVTQSNIAMGHLGIRQDDPSYYAVEVMNNVLSGSASSRLFSEVRTRQGLAYAVSGSVGAEYDHPGLTLLWMTTKTDSTAAGIEALLAEARGMTARPPTDQEVAKAKESILNSFVFNFDSPAKILRQQLTYEYYGYPLDRMERYRAGIEAVTPEEVRRAAAEHLHPDRFSILVVGPSEGLDRPLSEFGEVEVVDIAIPEPAAPEMEAGAEELARGAELIGRAVEAMGGAEAVDAVQALEMEMTMEMTGPGGSMEVPVRTVVAPPDRVRNEMTLPFGEMVVALDGEGGGWAKSPQGVNDLPGSQLQELRRALDRNVVVLLQARDEAGFTAAAIGSGEVAGTAVEQVRVRHDEVDAVLAIDPESGNILAISYRGAGPGGAPAEIELRFSDFRAVDGLSMPFVTERIVDGERAGGGTMTTARINPDIDPAEFVRPGDGDGAPAGER